MSEQEQPARVVVLVSGRVQGVGFRWWTGDQARRFGLAGRARNLRDGRVEVVVEGDRASCEAVVRAMMAGQAPGRVNDVDVRWEEPIGEQGFVVG